jgi:predicted RNase H-like HicB family nuclease
MRQVMVYRGEDGFWVAECPSLPGCISQGETQESALANVKEAIQAYIGALRDDNLPVPEDHLDARLVTV